VDPDVVIFMDGGCTANPGKIAVAAVACTPEGEIIAESARDAGEGTNNVAEYHALRHAIELANLLGARRPLFVSDSRLIVQQVNGYWALRDSGERARLHSYCTSALMKFDRWLLQHVGREKNRRSDWLVSKHLGHSRTLKNAPSVDQVTCEHEGRLGWSLLV
jgi:ribonuclease HI